MLQNSEQPLNFSIIKLQKLFLNLIFTHYKIHPSPNSVSAAKKLCINFSLVIMVRYNSSLNHNVIPMERRRLLQ